MLRNFNKNVHKHFPKSFCTPEWFIGLSGYNLVNFRVLFPSKRFAQKGSEKVNTHPFLPSVLID